MARENRKRKKEHMETLERDVDELRRENVALRQQLARRTGTVHRLRDERLYLKSVIANKTSIMTLLQTIRSNRLPITSSALGFQIVANDATTAERRDPVAVAGSAKHLLADDPLLCGGQSATHALTGNTFSLTDDEMLPCWDPLGTGSVNTDDDVCDDFAHLLDAPSQSHFGGLARDRSHQAKVSAEHNYTIDHNNEQLDNNNSSSGSDDDTPDAGEHDDDDDADEERRHRGGKVRPAGASAAFPEPGICLHMFGGRVSLEFCASCHRHAQNAWDEDDL